MQPFSFLLALQLAERYVRPLLSGRLPWVTSRGALLVLGVFVEEKN